MILPWVDPRVRGGVTRQREKTFSLPGRSPRARGSHQGRSSCPPIYGSIPACAGESASRRASRRHFEVDPRVRGGVSSYGTGNPRFGGRSPRARGSLFSSILASSLIWSIPACAGESHKAVIFPPIDGVDPRVRGGVAEEMSKGLVDEGRSPRARGSRSSGWVCSWTLRSIPACAGESAPIQEIFLFLQVDPRVRGGVWPLG